MISRQRVLVVDDHRPFANVVSEILEDEGYDVTVAYSAREALDVAEAARFDVAIVDFKLPEMSGAECLRRMSSQSAPSRVILITGCTREEVEAGDATPGALVLQKPFEWDALLASLR